MHSVWSESLGRQPIPPDDRRDHKRRDDKRLDRIIDIACSAILEIIAFACAMFIARLFMGATNVGSVLVYVACRMFLVIIKATAIWISWPKLFIIAVVLAVIVLAIIVLRI